MAYRFHRHSAAVRPLLGTGIGAALGAQRMVASRPATEPERWFH